VGRWHSYNPENGIVVEVERRSARGFIKNNPTGQAVVAHFDHSIDLASANHCTICLSMAIQRLYVDEELKDHPATADMAERLGLTPIAVDDRSRLFDPLKRRDDPWSHGKKMLLLTRNRGAFIKACPGTREYLCCGYQILHIGTYCTMDCSYCILQSYFHPPLLHYFLNQDDLFTELDEALQQNRIQRFGTGEFTDSLIWEPWSGLSNRLIQRFACQTRAVLELKTKTTAISKFKNIQSNRKTILAWSLNTPQIIASQERGTASLESRLRAAAQAQEWGYPLAFHFDPMIIYPGCEDHYRMVLERLMTVVSPENIVWISMGTFRYIPALKSIIEKRFADSDIIHGEFVPGLDGKMRYFKPLRIRLYGLMVEWLRELAPKVTSYLCMEDEQIWELVYGYAPTSKGGLDRMLDKSARMHCDLSD
jgi:spore photoproduct lyase